MAITKSEKQMPPYSLTITTSHAHTCNSTFPTKIGGGRVVGKLPVPGRPTIFITVGQGHTALAAGAGGRSLDIFLSSIPSLFFLPLFSRRPDID